MTIREQVSRLVVDAIKRAGQAPPAGATLEQIARFEKRVGITIPTELSDWLKMYNGVIIEPAALLNGVEPVQEGLDMALNYRLHPRWAEMGWIPIADDGCGDPYVMDAHTVIGESHPVYFVDHEIDLYKPDYIVASGLWPFLRFLLIDQEIAENGGESYWPFDRERVLKEDPALGEYRGPVLFPWVADAISRGEG